MAADLGTWPAEQATVLLEVLQAGGLHPDARRVRGEVHVTVPEDEGDKAHATLVANMDRIASAARPAKPPSGRGGGRKLRSIDGGKAGPSRPAKRRKETGPPASGGGSSRGRDAGRQQALVIGGVGVGVALLAAASGASPTFPLVLTAGALVWILGKRAERGL